MSSTPLEPTAGPTRDRIVALDVVRGVAVGGILFANVLVFFGLLFAPAGVLATLPNRAANGVAMWFGHVFVEGKFYSIFSLLFGIGFGLQLLRGGSAAVPRFRRRLRILLAIGALHAVLLWAGDILVVYALLGFTLPWFARRTDRSLLRWVAGLLATPTVLYLVACGLWWLVGPETSATGGGMGPPPGMLARFEAIGTGGLDEAFVGNLLFLAGRWFDLFLGVRFPKVLGMFVLGLWLVRRGIALDPSAHRAILVRWRVLGWSIGLPANIVAAWSLQHWSYLPPTLGGAIGVVMQAVGVPMLALGYTATIALCVTDARRGIGNFGPMGRMALSNYLMQSVICVVLSYGFGFGLWWRVGAAGAMAIAVAIILIQLPLSAWWLSRHRHGPMEQLWRRLTYGGAAQR